MILQASSPRSTFTAPRFTAPRSAPIPPPSAAAVADDAAAPPRRFPTYPELRAALPGAPPDFYSDCARRILTLDEARAAARRAGLRVSAPKPRVFSLTTPRERAPS